MVGVLLLGFLWRCPTSFLSIVGSDGRWSRRDLLRSSIEKKEKVRITIVTSVDVSVVTGRDCLRCGEGRPSTGGEQGQRSSSQRCDQRVCFLLLRKGPAT
eukprot:scpid106676/ scgid28053/ 